MVVQGMSSPVPLVSKWYAECGVLFAAGDLQILFSQAICSLIFVNNNRHGPRQFFIR